MISFKQYLLEADHKHEIHQEDAFDYALKHCKEALKLGMKPMVRGTFSDHSTAFVLTPETADDRKSANTSNYYTKILDETLGVAGYSLRSRSVIFANWENLHTAQDFGTVYAVLPVDGSKIGVCPFYDIFEVEIKIGGVQHGINIWNGEFELRDVPDRSFAKIVSGIEATLTPDFDPEHHFKDDFKKIFTPGKVKDQLLAAYDPKTLGFKLSTIAGIANLKGAHELWTSGKCIAIELDEYETLLKQHGLA